MRMQKYIRKSCFVLIGVLMLNLFFMPITTARATTLIDIDTSAEYAREAIEVLANDGVITGDANGYFNPQDIVTRAEMITLLVKALGMDTSTLPSTPTFQDVPKDHWAYKYVETAYKEGLIKGLSATTFGTDISCTREQMTVMFVRSLNVLDLVNMTDYSLVNQLSDKHKISSWAKEAVEFSLASGLVKGTSNTAFSAKSHAERQQIAVLTYRFINNKDQILEYGKSQANSVKYKNLLTLLTNSQTYVGDYTLSSTFNYGSTPNDLLSIEVSGVGVTNGTDMKLSSTTTLKDKGTLVSTIDQDIIFKDNAYYIRQDQGDWTEVSGENIPFLPSNSELLETNNSLSDTFVFNQAKITDMGIVNIGNTQPHKYTLSLDGEAIDALYAKELLELDLGSDPVSDISIDYYVNSQNQIIKQTLRIDATINDNGTIVPMEIMMDILYSNIGNPSPIEAPVLVP